MLDGFAHVFPSCCSLLPSQMFPYSLLAMAVLMYLPALIWRQLVMPSLGSDLLFIIDELDKSYNRSIRLAQNILDMRQNTKNPLTFQAELQRYEIGGAINLAFSLSVLDSLVVENTTFEIFCCLLLKCKDCVLQAKDLYLPSLTFMQSTFYTFELCLISAGKHICQVIYSSKLSVSQVLCLCRV